MHNQSNELRLLVIDDNPSIHADFLKILTVNPIDSTLEDMDKIFGNLNKNSVNTMLLPKFKIDTASQGQEGVERIKVSLEKNEPYALAFVDIRMPPGWDGIETIKHIWELDPDIQIVICSAYSDYSWNETIEHLGLSDNLLILKKPFDSTTVRQLACSLTKKWQLTQETKLRTEVLEKDVEKQLSLFQRSRSLIRASFEASPDGIVVIDSMKSIVDYNHQFLSMFDVPKSFFKKPRTVESLLQLIEIQGNNPHAFKILNECSSEKNILYLKNNHIIEHHSQDYYLGKAKLGFIWNFHDITNQENFEKKLTYQAMHDPLTNLPNRALLYEHLNHAVARVQRSSKVMALFFLDFDNFKLINDSLGHAAGDELLLQISYRLKKITRSEDLLARLGGDEFIIVASSLNSDIETIKLATKLINCFKKPFEIANRDIRISASIGVSIYQKNGETGSDLLRNADMAMYKAKELGGSQFIFYNENMKLVAVKRMEIESDLGMALQRGEFFLCYQPQINLLTGHTESVEALIRWNHPTKGVLLPLDFIPIAEESSLIVAIGEWVLRTACQQNKTWQDKGLPLLRVAVNVTTNQFKQANFVEVVRSILQETGLKPEFLEIEVTENVVITNIEVVNVINELKELGVNIVLDDFGTGNSSLNYLRKIPASCLKIDQSFIGNIDRNRNDEIIIQAIIAMARSMKLDVLAEGVETQAQLDFLKKENCEKIQGFYFSKPLEPDEIEKYLKKED